MSYLGNKKTRRSGFLGWAAGADLRHYFHNLVRHHLWFCTAWKPSDKSDFARISLRIRPN
ncbi:hypothetical protein [Pandoraea morbifera]|uniref:hypothetical protein n=1 Tax=Pandoraea morbifera TaxID=2508300 RepID=UPI0012418EFD|nr:hypothetical protein [Pandoraea morbifera]